MQEGIGYGAGKIYDPRDNWTATTKYPKQTKQHQVPKGRNLATGIQKKIQVQQLLQMLLMHNINIDSSESKQYNVNILAHSIDSNSQQIDLTLALLSCLGLAYVHKSTGKQLNSQINKSP